MLASSAAIIPHQDISTFFVLFAIYVLGSRIRRDKAPNRLYTQRLTGKSNGICRANFFIIILKRAPFDAASARSSPSTPPDACTKASNNIDPLTSARFTWTASNDKARGIKSEIHVDKVRRRAGVLASLSKDTRDKHRF